MEYWWRRSGAWLFVVACQWQVSNWAPGRLLLWLLSPLGPMQTIAMLRERDDLVAFIDKWLIDEGEEKEEGASADFCLTFGEIIKILQYASSPDVTSWCDRLKDSSPELKDSNISVILHSVLTKEWEVCMIVRDTCNSSRLTYVFVCFMYEQKYYVLHFS